MKGTVIRAKELMRNFVTSGMHEGRDVEVTRKVIMVNVVSAIGIINLIPLGILSFLQGTETLALCDLIVATALIINLVYLRKTGRYNFACYFGISFAGA